MATHLYMRKELCYLIAEGQADIEAIERVPENAICKVQFTVPRSIDHHRFFFAMLNIVFKNQREPAIFLTIDAMLDAIKIAVGHVREFRDFHGNTHIVPASISFGNMDQVAFKEFFDRSVDVILKNIVPYAKRGELEQEIYNMLGEGGPAQLERQ